MEQTHQHVEDVDPDRDIILVVGEAQELLKVNSIILKLASTVFRVMLSKTYKEGNEFAMR